MSLTAVFLALSISAPLVAAATEPPSCEEGTGTCPSMAGKQGGTSVNADEVSALLQSTVGLNTALQPIIEKDTAELQPFATVPIKWVIITKQDGTGNVSRSTLESRMKALNTYYNGGDPDDLTEEVVNHINSQPSNSDTCGAKCDIKKCSGSAFANLMSIEGCFCDTVVCDKWSIYGRLQGARADMSVSFQLESIKYVVNDVWHEQCCCAHASNLGYEEKQVEVIDAVVDKTTVRSSVTAIVCNMKSTMGMANILGGRGSACAGGPYVMLTTDFPAFTLAHEFGHFFGLYHTFDNYCPSGDKWGTCLEGIDVCDEAKNLGDNVADTPIHRKNGQCTVGADTCPNAAGKDPLDNMMSYSMCKMRRFTPGQVTVVHKTITDYFPAMLTSGGGSPKDLECDPELPNYYREGYKVACRTSGGCSSATQCCSGYGCGASSATGELQCATCEWKAFYNRWTSDSCIAPTPSPDVLPPRNPPPANTGPTPAPPSPPAACKTYGLCSKGSDCCAGSGCGASTADGIKGCATCEWKAYGYHYTSDSCL